VWRFRAEDIILFSALVPLAENWHVLSQVRFFLVVLLAYFIYVLCLTMLHCALGDISRCLRHSDMLYGCITVF